MLTVVVALALCAPAAASNGPVPGNQILQGPCVEQSKLTGNDFSYGFCGVPDLDQVRVTSGSFVGLPGNGHNYCAPTSTTNWFAYLATKGFVNTPAVKDYTDPANFNEASKDINDLGDLMGTTAAGGTGGGGMLDGITNWLLAHGTPKIKIGVTASSLDIVVKSFTTGGYYSPDVGALAQDALKGGLVVGVVGFYGQNTDPATNTTHLQRFGGHLVSVVNASGTLGTDMATLGVHDPATDWIDDDVQSAYKTDVWSLGASQPETYFYQDDQQAFHTYTATLPPVNGSTSTLFDGYVTIEPKTVETVSHLKIFVDVPLRFGPLPPGPVHSLGDDRYTIAIPTPGPVQDIALSPEGSAHPFLVKGSSQIYDADQLTGAAKPFAQGPAGASQLTFGGPDQTLYVAGTNALVGLDRSGHTVATTRLRDPVDALGFDARAQRLVAFSSADDRLRFFDTRLRGLGSIRLATSALSGKGRLSLAIAPNGRLALRRDGSTRVVNALPAVQRATRAGTVTTPTPVTGLKVTTRKLAVTPKARGLAIDDFGHMFVSVKGRLRELGATGRPLRRSPYNGLPAGPLIDVAHSFSNADPALHEPLDFLPADRQGPALPDLEITPSTGPQFTVHNRGFDAAGPFKVTVTTARGGSETFSFDGLAEGASVTQAYTCSPVSGTITVDSGNQVTESDETNNTGPKPVCRAPTG